MSKNYIMTEKQEKLLNCPFCGGSDFNIADPKANPAHESWVHCKNCDATSTSRSTKQNAIESWNTRATPDMHNELVEALKECISVIVDYTEYEHSGDPWEEDARAMGEMSIDDFERQGKLKSVIKTLNRATKEEE